jgi:hypothetical protein
MRSVWILHFRIALWFWWSTAPSTEETIRRTGNGPHWSSRAVIGGRPMGRPPLFPYETSRWHLELGLPPRPAPALERALLALLSGVRMEHPRLDRRQHLCREPEQPHVRRAVARGPVPAQLRHASLRQHVEPEAHVVRVGIPQEPGRVAVDRELERPGGRCASALLPGRGPRDDTRSSAESGDRCKSKPCCPTTP